MNDKTNFLGYSQNIGLTSNATAITTTNLNGGSTTINYDWNQFNGGNGTILSNGSDLTFSTLTINQNNMVRQVKAAVFTVERNEDNKVVSAKFIKEVWVEVKNGSSLDLAVAKELDKDFDPANIVVREIYSVTF